jgi:hypothetical protein
MKNTKSLLLICFLILRVSNNCKVEVKQDEIQPDSESAPLKLDRQTLGNLCWKILHNFAAGYPDSPSDAHKAALKDLFFGFRQLFPCEMCRGHFNKMIDENPLVDTDRKSLTEYLCKIHNIVNKRIGHEIFDCSSLDEYYGGYDLSTNDVNYEADDEKEEEKENADLEEEEEKTS